MVVFLPFFGLGLEDGPVPISGFCCSWGRFHKRVSGKPNSPSDSPVYPEVAENWLKVAQNSRLARPFHRELMYWYRALIGIKGIWDLLVVFEKGVCVDDLMQEPD